MRYKIVDTTLPHLYSDTFGLVLSDGYETLKEAYAYAEGYIRARYQYATITWRRSVGGYVSTHADKPIGVWVQYDARELPL